ncbi:flagellar export protein FliJ [Wukongibacter baidiensis]|uniref:flagellar export protein FliJ n=1 Tax=Wukongibacter baidiensis TaxID=1723361 RepID=UPI003D7FA42C
MKNFKFKYRSILSLLENKEDSIKNRLGQAYSILNEEKNKLNELQLVDRKYSELLRNETSEGCKLIFLRTIESYREELNRKMVFQNDLIKKKEDEIVSIKNELLEAMKEKKIMEKLKEKKLNEHNMVLKKLEENAVDQIVTYKNSLLHR